MTCFEKLREIHPEWTDEKIRRFVKEECPDVAQIMNKPEWCAPFVNCEQCWKREVPGAEPPPVADEPHIHDSGSRQEFSTGAVRDIQKGKGRCDLMPLDVVSSYYHHINEDCAESWIFYHLDKFKRGGEIKDLFRVLDRFRIFPDMETELLEVSKHFEEGAEKYGEDNWQKGLPIKCYINSAVRHYLKLIRGDNDERHDRAFVWNIMCAIWTCKHKPELNDYAPRKNDFDPDSLMGEYEEEND